MRYYRGKLRGQFDLVVDEINTIPFFTPMWVDIPTVALIFQLAREVWWYESKFPLSILGYVLEPLYLRLYRKVPTATISKSTGDDLRRLGFAGEVDILPIAIEPALTHEGPKARIPTFVYVGRIAASKRIEDVIRAFAQIRESHGVACLQIIGGGDARYVESLQRLARRLGVAESVNFLGHIRSDEKQRYLARAHALLMTSVREGWGLVITEANACGTPAIVYDAPGLRDAVQNLETGMVVKADPRELARAMMLLISDQSLYRQLASKALDRSREFSIDRTVTIFRALAERAVAAGEMARRGISQSVDSSRHSHL
jgi:glycosyltransferase involved in cell wall biosynthesis